MIQVTPQMRIMVATGIVDFRCGIDGLARVCRSVLSADPFSGTVFVFRNRRGTSIKILVYDGQGYWLCQKRLSKGRFRYWPTDTSSSSMVAAHDLTILLRGGDPSSTDTSPDWRAVTPKK